MLKPTLHANHACDHESILRSRWDAVLDNSLLNHSGSSTAGRSIHFLHTHVPRFPSPGMLPVHNPSQLHRRLRFERFTGPLLFCQRFEHALLIHYASRQPPIHCLLPHYARLLPQYVRFDSFDWAHARSCAERGQVNGQLTG